jgi:GT2 family glycosyltransferase
VKQQKKPLQAGPAAGTEHSAPADVDVLIPTCDRPVELAVALAGLAAQSHPSFRVMVSDQSTGRAGWEHPPAAAMVRVLRAQGREVTVLQHVPRRGLAEHRQFLFEQSAAPRCLFLDDDVWLEPGAVERLQAALDRLGCGFVGMAPQGLSYLADRRPGETAAFEPWDGPVQPEKVRPGTAAFDRWPLHNAANLTHLAGELDLRPDQWLAYRVAWVGGCAMYRRTALDDAGAFRFWTELGPDHVGEDVLAQWRIMEKFGGAGIIPSAAVHLESPTTVTKRDVQAYDVVLGNEG